MRLEVGQTYADTKREYYVERVYWEPNGQEPRRVYDMSFKLPFSEERSTRTFWASTVHGMIENGGLTRIL